MSTTANPAEPLPLGLPAETTGAARPRQDFQHHIHVFRAIAIMLIVVAHTLPSLDWSSNPRLGRLIDGIANESSIFFFFIAGYLFQYLSRSFRYRAYLLQKLRTVIVPYLILSVPAIVIFTQLTRRTGMWSWFYSIPEWQQVLLFFLTGKHLAPLWFVPTITLFYLAAPLFIWIDRRVPRLYWLVLPLWGLSLVLGRDGPLGPVNKAVYLLPVYLLGMAFSHHREAAQALVARTWPVLLMLASLGYAGYVMDWPEPPQYLMLMKLPTALLLVHLLLKTHHWFGNRLDYIAHVSFGIFFIHAYFISFIKVLTVWATTGRIYAGEGGSDLPASVLNVLLYAGGVLALSTVIIWAAQKLLGNRSRMLVGA